jgi:hypothetical protein
VAASRLRGEGVPRNELGDDLAIEDLGSDLGGGDMDDLGKDDPGSDLGGGELSRLLVELILLGLEGAEPSCSSSLPLAISCSRGRLVDPTERFFLAI